MIVRQFLGFSSPACLIPFILTGRGKVMATWYCLQGLNPHSGFTTNNSALVKSYYKYLGPQGYFSDCKFSYGLGEFACFLTSSFSVFRTYFCTVWLCPLESQRSTNSRCEVPGIPTLGLGNEPAGDAVSTFLISLHQQKFFRNTF